MDGKMATTTKKKHKRKIQKSHKNGIVSTVLRVLGIAKYARTLCFKILASHQMCSFCLNCLAVCFSRIFVFIYSMENTLTGCHNRRNKHNHSIHFVCHSLY